ncbi:MAG: NlpC/P60 family protein [Mangrovibacterium sp.]
MIKRFKCPFLCLSLLSLLFACSPRRDHPAIDKMVQQIKERYASDPRTALFRINVRSERQSLVFLGETTIPEAKQALLDSLAVSKIAVVDSIRILPDTTVGEKPWGLVTLSVGNMRVAPGHGAEMASQLLMGTPVKILQRDQDWYRIQSPDQYIGWCDGAVLAPLTEAELAGWKQSERYVYGKPNGFAFAGPDVQSQVVSDLVLSDLFVVSGEQKGFLHIRFPDGRNGYVLKSECRPYSEWIAQHPQVDKAIETAEMLTGSPYLWGGTSSKAVDCSGLMKTAWFSQGVILARDASQQARYGEILPVNDSLRFEPGDLLFFGRSKDRISHVGMYMGKGKYIHSSGLVRINSLSPQDSDYSEFNRKRLVSASRVINSLNTGEIVQVKEHPWYN